MRGSFFMEMYVMVSGFYKDTLPRYMNKWSCYMNSRRF